MPLVFLAVGIVLGFGLGVTCMILIGKVPGSFPDESEP